MSRTRRKTAIKTLIKNRLPLLLILAGSLVILSPRYIKPDEIRSTFYQRPKPVEVKKTITKPQVGPIKIDTKLFSNTEPKQPPQRIIIPGYKVDLPIVEAPVINGVWELSETTASHGVGSSNPGENGNVVIFAHARDYLFGPIKEIKPGEEIYILTKDRWHKYKVNETKLVAPDQVEVVGQTTEETLTLFTCSGFLDSKRLIVKAIPT